MLAAGLSSRMGKPKLLIPLKDGTTSLERSLGLFKEFENAVLVVSDKSVIKDSSCCVVSGGDTRFKSVCAGLANVSTKYVLIHDAARPIVLESDIDGVVKKAESSGAAILGRRVTSTVKQVNADLDVITTLDRNLLVESLTPQVYETKLLKDLVERATRETYTDEAELCEEQGIKVGVYLTNELVPKITYPSDIELVNGLLN